MADAGPGNQPPAGGGADSRELWSDEDDLLHYVSGSRIHLVGCGEVGGGHVFSINEGMEKPLKGVIAYTFQMDPSIEEEYRELRRRRARGEVTTAGVGGGRGGGAGAAGTRDDGIVRKIGRMFGFGRGGDGPAAESGVGSDAPAGDGRAMGVAMGDPEQTSEFEAMVGAISGSLAEANLAILVCGMDDPEGFEAARIFAEVAKERDVLTFGYVFLPHGFDKVDGVHRANKDLQRLRLIIDIVVVLPNQVHIAPEDLAPIIRETVEVTTTAGLVNVDVADLKSTVRGGNVALIGIGEAGGENRLTDAVRRALSHRLMLIDYAAVNKAVVNITGGEDMTIDEAEGASRWVAKSIKKEAKIVWGAEIDQEMEGRLRVFVMAAATPVEVLLYIYTSE